MDTKASSSSMYAKMINHIAFSVPDLDQAITWYKEVLGFIIVKEPVEFVADDSLLGMAVKDMHGPSLKKMRVALLSSANQVGLEIIEYVEPKVERRVTDNFDYWKSGFFHTCIIDPNIEELCKKIYETGGKQRSKIWEVVPDKGYKMALCEDPFGNIIQIITHEDMTR
jgi:catechol 2,3-dioxygenase-like lactoylglutathione lyase family enzyme